MGSVPDNRSVHAAARNQAGSADAPDTRGARVLPEGGPRTVAAPTRPVAPSLVVLPSLRAEPVRPDAAGVAAWRGSPVARAYRRRLLMPAAAISLGALMIGSALALLSLRGDRFFVYPLVGALSTALGGYGLVVRPLLVARAARRVSYQIGERGVELTWSRGRKVLIPPELVPPFNVVARSSPGRGPDSAASQPPTDIIFAGPPAWGSPWGAWRIVDDTWGLVGLDRPSEAIAALTRLRAASPTPAAWAAGVVTPPDVPLFGRSVRRFLRRG